MGFRHVMNMAPGVPPQHNDKMPYVLDHRMQLFPNSGVSRLWSLTNRFTDWPGVTLLRRTDSDEQVHENTPCLN